MARVGLRDLGILAFDAGVDRGALGAGAPLHSVETIRLLGLHMTCTFVTSVASHIIHTAAAGRFEIQLEYIFVLIRTTKLRGERINTGCVAAPRRID